jgi:hypothetical protein
VRVAGGATVAEATGATAPAPRDTSGRTLGWSIALGVVVLAGAVLAMMLHRHGHNQGDDFALYLRQARSIFDGDISQVVADNRFAVLNSGGAFSPIAYPWGFPLLLAPFVHQWGLDYDRLKLVEVGCFCAWIVLAHGVVRRRLGRGVALAVAAVMATTPMLLLHTDQLLSEFPHAMVLGVWLWWLDRVLRRGPLIGASTRQLVTVGVLAAAAYNVRRESLVLVGVILVVQIIELVVARRGRPPVPVPWLTVATPYLAFFGSVIAFQLLLPSMLIPDNGDSPRYVLDRFGDFTGVLTDQLGLGSHPVLGVLILLLAGAGMVVGCVKRPRLDVPLVALTLLSAITVSTHFRMVGRYYFQIFPWILYFAAAAIVAAAQAVRSPEVRRAAVSVAVVPLVILVGVHVVELPDDISAARDFNAAGRQQVGPTDPTVRPIYEAVAKYTEPDAVIGYFRARTMTLLTDRRSIQTTSLDRMLQNADYYAQQRFSDYYQPDLTKDEALQRGFVPVWENSRWILWRLPDHPPASSTLGGS